MNVINFESSIETSLERVKSAVFTDHEIKLGQEKVKEPQWVGKNLIKKGDGSEKIKFILRSLAIGAIRGAGIGFGLKGGIALVFSILQRRSLSKIIGKVFSSDVLKFTSFVSVYISLLRGINALLYVIRGKNDKINSAVSGFIASSALLLDDQQRRKEVALYLLFRAVYVAGNYLVRTEILPVVPEFEKIVFGAINIPIMYGFIYEPEILDQGYYNWMLSMGNVTDKQIGDTVRMTRLSWAARGFAPPPMKSVHYHAGPCTVYCLVDWLAGLIRAGKVYFPVHAIPLVLFKLKALQAAPFAVLSKSFFDFMCSCLFLTSYQTLIKSSMCFFESLLGYDSVLAPVTASVLTSLSCFFERRGRVTELLLYCCPRSAEATFSFLKKRGLVYEVKFGEILIFGITSSILMITSDKDFKPTYYKALCFVIGSG